MSVYKPDAVQNGVLC